MDGEELAAAEEAAPEVHQAAVEQAERPKRWPMTWKPRPSPSRTRREPERDEADEADEAETPEAAEATSPKRSRHLLR